MVEKWSIPYPAYTGEEPRNVYVYLPDGMEGSVFYEPSDNGYEREIRRHMAWLKEEDT